MTIVQSLIATSTMGGGSPPPPPTQQIDAQYFSDNNAWYCLGGSFGSGVQNMLSPFSYTYPGGTTGLVLPFTNNGEYAISPNILVGNGTWASNAITVDIWFYPTANNTQLLSEFGSADINSGYHYTVFEIDTSSHVYAHYYNGTPIVSDNPVIMNAWNHIWFTEDTQGGHSFELNGVANNSQNPVYFRSRPTSGESFVVGSVDSTNMNAGANAFQGYLSDINIHDYVVASTYLATRSKYTSLPTVFQSGVPGATDGTWGTATINGTYSTWPSGTPGPGTGVILSSGSYVSVPIKLNRTSWTVEVIAELSPSSFWATIWGNDVWSYGQGYIAYLGGSTNLNVGAAGGSTASVDLTGISIADRAYWTFINDSGTIHVYRNGSAITVGGGFSAPTIVPTNDFYLGARHGNGGSGATDFCPGTYYYFNIRDTALDSAGVTSAFESIRSTYGI